MVKKRFPSQIRYEKKHPLVCYRSTEENYQRLEQKAKKLGMTKSDLLRMLVNDFEINFKKVTSEAYTSGRIKGDKEGYTRGFQEGENKGFQKGHSNGFTEGKKIGHFEGRMEGKTDWGIWSYCPICGRKVFIIPNSAIHEDVIEFLRYQGFGHAECIEQDDYW